MVEVAVLRVLSSGIAASKESREMIVIDLITYNESRKLVFYLVQTDDRFDGGEIEVVVESIDAEPWVFFSQVGEDSACFFTIRTITFVGIKIKNRNGFDTALGIESLGEKIILYLEERILLFETKKFCISLVSGIFKIPYTTCEVIEFFG